MVLPGFILLGFAVGAGVVSALFLVGGPMAVWIGASFPLTLALFAVVSLVAWVGLRRMVGLRTGQVRRIDKDIND